MYKKICLIAMGFPVSVLASAGGELPLALIRSGTFSSSAESSSMPSAIGARSRTSPFDDVESVISDPSRFSLTSSSSLSSSSSSPVLSGHQTSLIDTSRLVRYQAELDCAVDSIHRQLISLFHAGQMDTFLNMPDAEFEAAMKALAKGDTFLEDIFTGAMHGLSQKDMQASGLVKRAMEAILVPFAQEPIFAEHVEDVKVAVGSFINSPDFPQALFEAGLSDALAPEILAEISDALAPEILAEIKELTVDQEGVDTAAQELSSERSAVFSRMALFLRQKREARKAERERTLHQEALMQQLVANSQDPELTKALLSELLSK